MNKYKILILLIILNFLMWSCSQNRKNKLFILFDKIESIEKGVAVKLKGVTIGEVTNFDLLGDSVLVEINLDKGHKIPIDSKFSISIQLIGTASIIIDPSDQNRFINSNDTVYGTYEPKGLLDTFFSDSSNRKNAKEAIEKIVTGIKELEQSKKDTVKAKNNIYLNN